MWWASDGGPLIVLIEAFLANGYGVPEVQRDHAQRRSWPVRCGATHAYVTVTLAAYNPGTCRYLTDDKRCGIYEHRPLVCRIYPIEINPHIQLRRERKDCAPEVWDESGPVVYRDGRLVNEVFARLIERSRQADRDEINIKVEICRRLGINVAALKGDGFAIYRPDPETLLATIMDVVNSDTMPPGQQDWSLCVSRQDIADHLASMEASVTGVLPAQGQFIRFSA